MAKYYFTLIDISILFVSLITFILSICTDILICIQFVLDGQVLWSWLMAGFITLPSVLMNAFSFAWHLHDKTVTPLVIISHLLLMAPIYRYLKGIIHGIKSLKTRKVATTQEALKEQSDAIILRLFESFLECGPLLVLQCYILLYERSVAWFLGISAACSLISLTWSMTSYTDSQRGVHAAKSRRQIIRLLLHWAWQVFVTVSRIAALVFFARTFQYWIFVLVGSHWLIAFLWLSLMGTDFGTGHWEKWLFRLVCGFMYIFVYLNVNDGASRWRVTAYYMLFFLENTAAVILYFVLGNGLDMVIAASLVVFAGFFIGLLFMIFYYQFVRHSEQKGRVQRFISINQRASVISGSSVETGSQVFSVESPSPVNVVQDVVINIDQDVTTSQNTSSGGQPSWTSQLSPVNSRYSGSEGTRSHASLQKVWESGMISSSSSSSSLLSIVESANSGGRTPSIKSAHSRNSVSSENSLLPTGLGSSDVVSAPLENLKLDSLLNVYKQIGDKDSTDTNHLPKSVSNKSPTLSRSSWARSSDLNRNSMIVGDFTVLGFDDSSSTDRKNSDSSSFSSHPKSMSPLNVSLLWKEGNSRLRATIAATIAEVTGISSSTEATPNKTNAFSFNSGEDSLNSPSKAWTMSHNTAFMESVSSFKEESSKQSTSMDSSRREALVSLPDIKEVLDQDQCSDISSTENTFVRSFDSPLRNSNSHHISPKTDSSVNHSHLSKISTSSYPEDSTLTLSKLGMKDSTSFNQMQKQEFLNNMCRSPLKSPSHSDILNIMENRKDGSPFTDQELVQVMASSLQSYIGASSSYDSNVREGLALTIDDLRLSRDTSPEESVQTSGQLVKSRSASSLFHDSTESSPASSASKMNHQHIAQKADKFSPNGLKIIDSPCQVTGLGIDPLGLSEIRNKSCGGNPQSLALKFIMDAYGSGTQMSHNSLHLSRSNPVPSARLSTSNDRRLSGSSVKYSDREKMNYVREAQRRSENNQHLSVHRLDKAVLPNSFAKRRSKSSYTVYESDNRTRGAVSSTKKLSVHFSPSPTKAVTHNSQFVHTDSRSDLGYVAGQYCPPLCSEINLETHKRFHPLAPVAARTPSQKPEQRQSGKISANKSLPNIEFYSPSVNTTGRQKNSLLSSHTHKMANLSDDELKLSAKLVASYFSNALETGQDSGHRKHLSQPQLRVHHSRQPLQPLDNSPHFSPERTHPHRNRADESWRPGTQQLQMTQSELLKLPRRSTPSAHQGSIEPLVYKPPVKNEMDKRNQWYMNS